MRSTSIFGRERPSAPSPTPLTAIAHAKALVRIPAIFGGRPVYRTFAAPADFAASATVEATSPETFAALTFPRIPFLYGNDDTSIREMNFAAQPMTTAAIERARSPSPTPAVVGETHAPPTRSTSQQSPSIL